MKNDNKELKELVELQRRQNEAQKYQNYADDWRRSGHEGAALANERMARKALNGELKGGSNYVDTRDCYTPEGLSILLSVLVYLSIGIPGFLYIKNIPFVFDGGIGVFLIHCIPLIIMSVINATIRNSFRNKAMKATEATINRLNDKETKYSSTNDVKLDTAFSRTSEEIRKKNKNFIIITFIIVGVFLVLFFSLLLYVSRAGEYDDYNKRFTYHVEEFETREGIQYCIQNEYGDNYDCSIPTNDTVELEEIYQSYYNNVQKLNNR